MPRKKKKFIDKKNARTYHVVSGETTEGNVLEAQAEDVEVVDYATVTTRGGGGGKYVKTRRVRHILGEDPVRDSYANPVMDRALRKYLKPIGEDLRGVFVSKDGSVTAAKYLKGATALRNAPEFLNLQTEEKLEDMGDGVGLRSEAAAAPSRERGESDDDFLPDYSSVESDEVEYRTDAIALPSEEADPEVAALLDQAEFDSDAVEEFGELQDDFVAFAIADEEKHPRLVEDEEHVKVAADFEERRRRLMDQVGIDDSGDEGGDEGENIPFGFGLDGEGGSEDDESNDTHARRGRDQYEQMPDDAEEHDWSDVVGSAARYRQRFVDEHFDVAVKREYDNEEEWGEMGEDDITGGGIKPESALFQELMDEFNDEPEQNKQLFNRSKEITEADLEKGRRVALQHGSVDLPDITEEEYFNKPKRNNWDCATIVSTYSNLENHPSVIDGDDMSGVIMLSAKTGMPVVSMKAKRKQKKKKMQEGVETLNEEDEEGDSEDGESDEEGDDDSDGNSVMTSMTTASVSTRAKNETAQERRERKAAVKEARRLARANKKSNEKCVQKGGCSS
eukprot:INCI14599.1.p1 GENE.INCI14599.1~~INCI14599.1.p1  ORF type:complete len:563 (+),score=158.17 INCI14599.1:124-1812(+)